MVSYLVLRGIDYNTAIHMDIVSICEVHDRLFVAETGERAEQARLMQIATQGDGKTLGKVLEKFDEVTGVNAPLSGKEAVRAVNQMFGKKKKG